MILADPKKISNICAIANGNQQKYTKDACTKYDGFQHDRFNLAHLTTIVLQRKAFPNATMGTDWSYKRQYYSSLQRSATDCSFWPDMMKSSPELMSHGLRALARKLFRSVWHNAWQHNAWHFPAILPR